MVKGLVNECVSVFSNDLVPGAAKVEPMIIKMRTDWNPDKLQPIRRYDPAVGEALQHELNA